MSSIKTILVLIVALVASIGIISCDERVNSTAERKVTIQIYADRGVPLPNGKIGGAVQAYGVELQKDNTEKVLWKTFLWSFHGLLFDRRADIAYLPSGKVAVFLYAADTGERYYEFNLSNGQILKRAKMDKAEFGTAYKGEHIIQIEIPERPKYEGPREQTLTVKYHPDNQEKQNSVLNPITKQQAIDLALKTMNEKGWNPERYDMTVKDNDNEWMINFEGKMPRPPGDEAIVYISKKDGSVRFMQGE